MEEHPRLALLRSQVLGLPVSEPYQAALLASIDTYRDHFLSRPVHAPHEGWDDLEALQQVTLGDMMERSLRNRPASFDQLDALPRRNVKSRCAGPGEAL